MTRPVDGPEPLSAPLAIEARRTARSFDPDRPLPEPVLERLLSLAAFAPSLANLQPWRFLVVRTLANRRKLRGCTFGESRITEAPAVLIVLAYLHPDRTDLVGVLDRMLALGAIDPPDAARLRATTAREWARGASPTLRATRPAMLAAAGLMIAAESLGVASAWLDGSDEEAVREAFGIPDDHALCGLIALGYAAEPSPFPGRFGLDRSCFEEHFGLPWTPASGGWAKVESATIDPPPQPSPTRGEGVRLKPSPLWGRVGVGGGFATLMTLE